MSMIACSECGAEVSTSAKACPGCGAGARVFRRPSGKKPLSLKRKIGFGVLGLFGFSMLVAMSQGSTPAPPRTPDELAQDSRAQAAYLAVKALKQALREPESAVFEKVSVDDHAYAVCLTYRARNGFGGMNREHMVFVDGKPSQQGSVWNRHCAHKKLYNLTAAASI